MSPEANPFSAFSTSAIYLSLALCLTGCRLREAAPEVAGGPTPKHGREWTAPIRVVQDFAAEQAYVRARRTAAGAEPNQETVALCFSGGGLRAATVQLGVLQGLEEKDILKSADYLSSVSGGSYAASWFVSHLLPPGRDSVATKKTAFRGGHMSYVADRGTLLQVSKTSPCMDRTAPGPVDELELNRGFVFGKGNVWMWSGIIPAAWAASMPLNALFDVGLHYKPVRGKFNMYHPNKLYEKAIRSTYLQAPEKLIFGQEDEISGFFRRAPHEVRLDEINPMGGQAPYLVMNAALANNPDRGKIFSTQSLPFEFSRDSCGAPHLGYVHSRHFGYPVQSVTKDAKGGGTVTMTSNWSPVWPMKTKPVLLASAVAASGAALDSNMSGKVKVSPLTWPQGSTQPLPSKHTKGFLWNLILKPLNANLRYQNRNFAMESPLSKAGYGQPPDKTLDRLREVTLDRSFSSTSSNTLILSDGGHWDNLGVYAMTQRPHVKEIWSFDAAQDLKYDFSSLNNTLALLKAAGWEIDWHGERPQSVGEELAKSKHDGPAIWPESRGPVFPATLTYAAQNRSIRLYYVKASLRASDGAGRCYIDNKGGKWSLDKWFAAYRMKGVTGKKFPQTSTFNLSFTRDDFNTYRELGRLFGVALGEVKHRGK